MSSIDTTPSHASGFWGDANHVRILLADVYEQSGEADAAVDLLVLAGEAKKAEETAKEAGDHYLDTRKHLAKPAYWIPATGFRVSAIQADLVPDDQVGEIVENAIDVLRRGRASFATRRSLHRPWQRRRSKPLRHYPLG